MSAPILNPFVATWSYRSLLNDPDLNRKFDALEFGRGTLTIAQDAAGALTGTIGGSDWQLTLYGGFGFGSGEAARFRGTGLINGETWIYDYWAVCVPIWQNSTAALQRPTLVGSVTRVVPHSGGTPGSIAPAGVVASFYAPRQG
jgi:hypothetical protein